MTTPAVERPTPTVSAVLDCATLRLEGHPADRVTSVDVTRVVIEAADQALPDDRSAAYWLACGALDALTAHRTGLGEDPKDLDRWSTVYSRVEMVAQMRAAAGVVSGV